MKHLILLIIGLSWPLAAQATPQPDDLAGRVVAQVNGKTISLPMLESRFSVDIQGDMATVELRQRFANPSSVPLEAEYLFPLNQKAAVFGMTMQVGDEIIKAVMREKAKAEATFEQAAAEGKAAALLTQHRPNMFTQKIANLMPGKPVDVTLKYVQMVPKVDGQYELVVPLIVGPRYQGAPAEQEPQLAQGQDSAPAQPGSWSIAPPPAYPAVAGLNLPTEIAPERVSLELSMVSGIEMSGFGSPTHPLDIVESEDGLRAGFAQGKVLDNKDLVLRYALGGDAMQAAALSHHDERGGFVSVMIEPPALPDDAIATPRELVFVLDTSGSMSGQPLAASKTFMDAALSGLRPHDFFRIIPFANTAQQFSRDATPATPANIANGRRFVSRLSAGGGTEIDAAIRTAFATQNPADTMRIVVFLSDGYIGDEARVLRTIREQIGAARIYAFGIGDAVNRYLLDAMADEGRGYARYVGLSEDALEVARDMAARLKTPLLTDLVIDWGGLDVADVTPRRLPDLFAGSSLRVYARYSGAHSGQIAVKGLVRGAHAELPVDLVLSAGAGEPALPLIWARNRIADLTRRIAVRDGSQGADAEITRLGLKYALQTRNTSFVAVSEQVVNDTATPAQRAAVPLPMVSGVTQNAYPSGFAGSSSPEPEAILGVFMVILMTLMGLRPWRVRRV